MAESSAAGGGALSVPGLEEALAWQGHRVDEIGGSTVARAAGVYVDAESGRPEWLVAKVGRFGKTTAIPFRDCAPGVGRVWVAHQREMIRKAPAIEAGRPLTREHELALCEHYGMVDGVGRAGEVGGRDENSVTARPGGEAQA